MGRVAHLLRVTESQAWTSLVGLVVAATMAILGIPPTLGARPASGAPSSASGPAQQPGVPPTVAVPTPAPTAGTPVLPPGPLAPLPLQSGPGTPVQPEPADGGFGAEPQFAPSDPPAAQPTSGPTARPDTRGGLVAVTGSGYSAPYGGTPVGDAAVATGSLPVERVADGNDTRSYLLVGTSGRYLTLRLQQAVPAAAVVACPLASEGYEPVRGQAPDDAPQVDCRQPIEPKVTGDQYVFDLGTVAPDERSRGIALVPAAGSTPFQARFEDPAASPSAATGLGWNVTLPAGDPTSWLSVLFPWLASR